MVWGYGAFATASGLAAAWWHGLLKLPPEIVEVTVPRECRRKQLPGSNLRRRDLNVADIVERRGLRVTTVDLTTVEAAARLGGGPKVMDSALQRHTELPDLWRAHLRNKGRHGSPRARRLLQAASDGTRSQAERLLVQLLKDARLTGWTANHPIGGYLVDVAFPMHKLAIEVDGWAFHSDQHAFQNDRVRQNRISLQGWKVLRFTWQDLTENPERVIAEIRRAIRGT